MGYSHRFTCCNGDIRLATRQNPAGSPLCGSTIVCHAPAWHLLITEIQQQSPIASRFSRFQWQDGWSIEDRSIGSEVRTMARTVPALFKRIPMHDAANMSACG